MGNLIANEVKNANKQSKKELIETMNQLQKQNIPKFTEVARRMNEANNIAWRRDRVHWFLGFYVIGAASLSSIYDNHQINYFSKQLFSMK